MTGVSPILAARRSVPAPRLALLGTGVVGRAFVARHQSLQRNGIQVPAFAWLANSRALDYCQGGPGTALDSANAIARGGLDGPPSWAETEALRRGDIVVDATASDSVAEWHARWLAHGVHVVTANKLGSGADASRAASIVHAQERTGAHYGDSATVGAGLPLLSSLRALVHGGDRIHRIEGVLSGSLAWLFDRFDGSRPFSALVREACAAGYTEPDPRIDLSGEDVRRKLLILARAAGIAISPDRIRVASLVPMALARLPASEVDAHLVELDQPLAEHLAAARASRSSLRFVARVDAGSARAELVALPADHPLSAGTGTDNRVAIHSDRYPHQPLLIQGPGAGAEVTAAALLDDVLRLFR
jgi:homoserine dehydrogenase